MLVVPYSELASTAPYVDCLTVDDKSVEYEDSVVGREQ